MYTILDWKSLDTENLEHNWAETASHINIKPQVGKYVFVISTESALRRPLTYDNHPIPTKPLNELRKPHMIPGRPPMN